MSACLIHILLVSPPVLIHISFSISLSLALSLSQFRLSLSLRLSRSLSLACLGGGDRATTRWKRQSGVA